MPEREKPLKSEGSLTGRDSADPFLEVMRIRLDENRKARIEAGIKSRDPIRDRFRKQNIRLVK